MLQRPCCTLCLLPAHHLPSVRLFYFCFRIQLCICMAAVSLVLHSSGMHGSLKWKVLSFLSLLASLTGLPVTDQPLTSVCFLASCSAATNDLSTLANSSASHSVFGFPLNTLRDIASGSGSLYTVGPWDLGDRAGELSLHADTAQSLLPRHLLMDTRTARPLF